MESLYKRALKRIGNEIVSVSLKALIIMVAAAILSTATVIWLALRSNPHGPWFYAAAGVLCCALFNILVLAGLVGLRMMRGNKGQSVNGNTAAQLTEAQSLIKHWQGEFERVQQDYVGRLETVGKLWRESQAAANNLQQRLDVAQTKLEQFAVPRARLKILKAEYAAPGKAGTDVADILDRMILDDQLVIDVSYNKIFRPDPWPHISKELRIEFSHGLKEFSITVPEDAAIRLPFPYK